MKNKKIISEQAIFPFDFVSKKVSLAYFQEWCKENIPTQAEDICLELDETSEMNCKTNELLNIRTNLLISWKLKK